MGNDYRQIQMWKQGGHTQTGQGGTTVTLTFGGTTQNGEVTERWLLGANFLNDTAPMDLLVLSGTRLVVQARGIPAGYYNTEFPVYPASDVGTNLVVVLDSTDGTVSLNAFAD